MDCLKAETAMMRYIEKTLKPEDARDLAKHVLRCEPCRELYLMMDASADILEAPPAEPPEGFTEKVMALVRNLHENPESAMLEVKNPSTPSVTAGNAVFRVLWGLSGIVMGVALLFALNPHWIQGTAVHDAMTAIAAFFADITAWLGQIDTAHAIINSGLGIAALVFAVIIIALLYGLHRGENTAQKSQA
ncbi:MAG: hypothetical protein FWE90_00070 [Defluviitaleaceae bacterium]|nr:hypothetical protein [Defluviitaleaceae bacterium]